ncbi:hypothetical protein [Eleftheria terrae]|uniref:hypothetical protein n=1 Tax=Eleftheria terrae TaxID=1597781 RepID=UPI00263B7725|nr:hypothetical protein [Eleftheria terrae]WKB52535.1 hypothetical protein N7L95_22495 [Eleftheria terrae]
MAVFLASFLVVDVPRPEAGRHRKVVIIRPAAAARGVTVVTRPRPSAHSKGMAL